MPTLDLITSLAIETIIHSVQAFLLLGFVALLRYYVISYNHQYLRYWSWACLSYGTSELVRVMLATLALQAPESAALYAIEIRAVALSLMYLSIAFLTFGTFDAAGKKITSRGAVIAIYGVVFACALATYQWSIPNASIGSSVSSNGTLRFLVPGIMFLVISTLMLRNVKAGIGPKLVAISFLFVAAKNTLVLGACYTLSPQALEWVMSFEGVATIIALVIIMIGIIIWVLESERSTAIEAIQKAEYLHTHDALTGASNRAQLVSKIPLLIDFCRSNNRQLTICLIGLSRFKSINENFGIKGGDQVLKEVACRLQRFHKQPIAVARISGDVFAVLFDHLKSRQLIRDLGIELQQTVAAPMTVNDKSISLATGVGIARYPQHGSNAEILLNKATIALTESKKLNQTDVVFFERGMDDVFAQLMDMEPILKKAFREDQFVLYLQPQFDFDHQQLCGFEALIRWNHPERGLLSPAEFLPYIEQLGLTETLDTWVLHKAASILQRWKRQFGRCWPIAVNLSAQQFQHFSLIDQLSDIVQEHAISPGSLELEITETVAMSDLHNGRSVINKLRQLGFNVAIDDFGTGHSSLAYLRSLPISKIKIDRSFVSELQENRKDATILKAMIRLAHGLGKRVIAEGIETQDQQDILQQLGCDMMQGYFYSAPMRIEFAEQMIEAEIKQGNEPLPDLLAEA